MLYMYNEVDKVKSRVILVTLNSKVFEYLGRIQYAIILQG